MLPQVQGHGTGLSSVGLLAGAFPPGTALLLLSPQPCRAMALLQFWSTSGSQAAEQTDLCAVSVIESQIGKEAIPLSCKFVRN